MITAGIDAGSRTIKIVLRDGDGSPFLAHDLRDQGIHQEAIAESLFSGLLASHSLDARDVRRIVATGYGRASIRIAHTAVTEITCHARGVQRLHPEARTVIDIGGQDSKVIWLDADGRVRDFAMNDRCAAGTGRFLEVVASRLETPVDRLGDLALRSTRAAAISSTCVVFAETEIIGLLATETPPEDIVAGVQKAIAQRVAAMAGHRIQEPVFFTGGVALVSGMAHALESALGCPIAVAAEPQFTGALGASLIAAEESGVLPTR
jgi:predicted CoA-substrate-specific enzyme activase